MYLSQDVIAHEYIFKLKRFDDDYKNEQSNTLGYNSYICECEVLSNEYL